MTAHEGKQKIHTIISQMNAGNQNKAMIELRAEFGSRLVKLAKEGKVKK